jgi:hypothetical protein
MEPEIIASSEGSSPDLEALREAIRRRAEEIYVEGGNIEGRDAENWARAEWEIQSQFGDAGLDRKKAVVVKVNDVEYIGEYRPEPGDGYVPGEFAAGASVEVRFEGQKMFVKRPNGKELETNVVRRIG